MKKLIPYAGYEPPAMNNRRVPVKRAVELRNAGLGWKQVAWELTQEYDRDLPFTADGVQAAVARTKQKESA